MTLGDSPRKNPPFYAGSFQRTFHWVRGSLGYIWIQLSWGNSLIRRLFFRELRSGIMSHVEETLNFMGKMLWGMMSFMTFMTSTNSSLDWNQWYPKVPIKCFPSIHLSFVDCLVWTMRVIFSTCLKVYKQGCKTLTYQMAILTHTYWTWYSFSLSRNSRRVGKVQLIT